jgi:aminotransferase EvaB
MKNLNFLPNQYKKNKKFTISHNYLSKQFSDYKIIQNKIKKIIKFNDFTLGSEVNKFEKNFSSLIKSKYCIGVGSGTDAIYLALKTLGLGNKDEVITTPYTFYATVNAIVQADCTPKFVDASLKDFNIDPSLIEKKITKKTKAILVVHWAGRICDMTRIKKIAKKYKLFIIEDACHAALAHNNNIMAGNFGDIGCFSMHPLKNLNVWGDGGMIVTNKNNYAEKIMLLRNHGLKNRNNIEIFGINSRLDTIQAVVANHVLKKLNKITNARIKNAKYLDKNLKIIKEIYIPERTKKNKEVFHIYCLQVKNRNKLAKFLTSRGIDAKIHYPIPMHLQKPSKKKYGYKKGDFPISEKLSNTTISLPVHEFIKKKELNYMIKRIKEFYSKKINS